MAVFRPSPCRFFFFLIFPKLLSSRRGNDGLCQGYWAWLWLVRRLSTISIKTATAAGLMTGFWRGSRWENYVPPPQLGGGDTNPHVICKFNVIVYFFVACSITATTVEKYGKKNNFFFLFSKPKSTICASANWKPCCVPWRVLKEKHWKYNALKFY